MLLLASISDVVPNVSLTRHECSDSQPPPTSVASTENPLLWGWLLLTRSYAIARTHVLCCEYLWCHEIRRCELPMTALWETPCHVRNAAHNSGPRPATWIRHIIIHSAESRSAAGVAAWFARPTTQASTQLAVDDKECWRMVPDLTIPWGASGANRSGLHIEICGYARWPAGDPGVDPQDEWHEHHAMLNLAAAKCAKWMWRYDLPDRWLRPYELKKGIRGFATHYVVNQAFGRGDHTDPGPGFPYEWFMQRCRAYHDQIVESRLR